MSNDGILDGYLDYAPNYRFSEGTREIHLLYAAQDLLPYCPPFWNLSEPPFLQMEGNEHSMAVGKVIDLLWFNFAFYILELHHYVSGNVSNKHFDVIGFP
jgi:hypothetical protein